MTIRKIIAATDFSEPARAALEEAAAIASAHQATLVIAHVADPRRHPSATLEAERGVGRRLLDRACAELGEGFQCTSLLLEGFPDEQIVEMSRTEAADLVVVGSCGHGGVPRLSLGSVAQNVVRQSEIPVLVARGAGSAFGRILVATDFSDAADRALALAMELVAPGGIVDVLHVVYVPAPIHGGPPALLDASSLRRLEVEAARKGAELVIRHRRPGIDLRFAWELGKPRAGVLRRLESGHDLVALGSHGARGLRRLLLGSVAGSMVQHAPCSVLVTN